MSWGFRPALPLTGGSDPGDLCPPWTSCSAGANNTLRVLRTILLAAPIKL